ncbi:MAG: hypothetical protein JXA37_06545 [Chloroflexia bacterium]|nr:hypothetical protein [Chloroflexia bacterium]
MDFLTAVILLSPCLLVGLLMFFVVAMRYISYRERIELAQFGIYQPEEETFWDRLNERSPRGVLWAGVITTMCGLALVLGLRTIGIGWWLLGGLIPLFVGLGLLFMYFTGGQTRKQELRQAELPDPVEAESVEPDE